MKINRAYKFRIYPNTDQSEFLDKSFGCCRFLWNKMIHERIEVEKEKRILEDKLKNQ